MTKFRVVRECDKFIENHRKIIQNYVTVECGVSFVSVSVYFKIW